MGGQYPTTPYTAEDYQNSTLLTEERRMIQIVLCVTSGHKKFACKLLKISERHFHRVLIRHQINPGSYKDKNNHPFNVVYTITPKLNNDEKATTDPIH